MKSRICSLILSVFLLFAVVSCGPPPAEQLKSSGLFGEHSLARIESFGSVQGSVSGSFFLGIGSVNGSLGSEFKIQFYWSPKPGEIIATALPYSKFRFILDETKTKPTVEFVFDDFWLNGNSVRRGYSEESNPNLNEFVLSDDMKLAKVRISRATLEKEVYFPKIK